jgi:hypothetical protein
MQVAELREKTRELLQGALKHVNKASLAAALVPLGAVAVPAPAQAAMATNSGQVTGTVSGSSPTFTYAFTVQNNNTFPSMGGVSISSFSLPLFGLTDLNTASITTPSGWTFSITTPSSSNWTYTAATDPFLSGNPNKYGPNPSAFNTPVDVLVFSTTTAPVMGQSSLGGFRFTSQFSSLAAPSQANFAGTLADTDPPMPLSQARMTAQGLVPEPASIVMAGTAGVVLAAGFGYRALRRRMAARRGG